MKHLPKWLFVGYCKLWVRLGDKEFRFKDFRRAFKHVESENAVLVGLTEMKQAGWVTSKREGKIRLYKLVPFENILRSIAKSK